MPLVVLTGFPSSGKSTRSQQLIDALSKNEDLQSQQYETRLINNEALGLKPRHSYINSTEEKKARASFMAAVNRYLNTKTIVIADSLNYTKSERYQLFCVVRELQTTHCIIHCATPMDICSENNSNRTDKESQLDAGLFLELCRRYEEPRDSQRWDNPLFTVQHDDLSLPIDEIIAALTKRQPRPAVLATATSPPSQGDYLYNLDKAAQTIITEILKDQKDGKRFNENVDFISLNELARHKRQFISIHSKLRTSKTANLLDGVEKMQQAFRDYLEITLK